MSVAVGVAERRNRPAADERVYADGLPLLIVDQVDLGEPDEHGAAVPHLELRPDDAADDVLGRDAPERVRPAASSRRPSPGIYIFSRISFWAGLTAPDYTTNS
jgi:hypothetical protein